MPPEPAREIGSEFHWDPDALLGTGQGGGLPGWLPAHELFATGCGALRALLRWLPVRGRLHVPSYFCTGVAAALAEDVPIAFYRHLPDGIGPRWDSLRVRPGDVVLAQNLFGREDGAGWPGWRDAHPGVTVVEDHSHDPFGDWARTSTAPYAVASLRKTLPLPDGGLLWSPQGLELPGPTGPESPGAHLKLAAMLLKTAWRDGAPVPKGGFRALQQRGEQVLLGSTGPAGVLTTAVLPLLDVAGLRARSLRNARSLAAMLSAGATAWQVLDGGTPHFRVQVVCPAEDVRDMLLGYLAGHGIFAPVHWRQDRSGVWSGDDESADLASRMLTLPVDHRCEPADLHRLAAVLSAFELPATSREAACR